MDFVVGFMEERRLMNERFENKPLQKLQMTDCWCEPGTEQKLFGASLSVTAQYLWTACDKVQPPETIRKGPPSNRTARTIERRNHSDD